MFKLNFLKYDFILLSLPCFFFFCYSDILSLIFCEKQLGASAHAAWASYSERVMQNLLRRAVAFSQSLWITHCTKNRSDIYIKTSFQKLSFWARRGRLRIPHSRWEKSVRPKQTSVINIYYSCTNHPLWLSEWAFCSWLCSCFNQASLKIPSGSNEERRHGWILLKLSCKCKLCL